jgi:hypothetical protein
MVWPHPYNGSGHRNGLGHTTTTVSGATPNLFSGNFESATLPGQWSGASVGSTDRLSIDTNLSHGGHASLEAIQTPSGAPGAGVFKSIAGQTKVYMRGYYYLSTPVNRGVVQLMSLYAGGHLIGWVGYNVDPSSPTLTVYNAANRVLYHCANVPSLNAWHSIELGYALSLRNTGSLTVWMDGVRICAASPVKTAPAPHLKIDRVVTGAVGDTAGLTVHVADVVVSQHHIGI